MFAIPLGGAGDTAWSRIDPLSEKAKNRLVYDRDVGPRARRLRADSPPVGGAGQACLLQDRQQPSLQAGRRRGIPRVVPGGGRRDAVSPSASVGRPPRQAPYKRTYANGKSVWVARYVDLDKRARYAKPRWNGRKSSFARRVDAQRAIDEALSALYGAARDP